MLTGPVSHLIRALFIVLMSGGGGDLPALDGVLFHSHPVTLASHFEASGGCHADQCSIRATANHPPLTPALVAGTPRSAESAAVSPPLGATELLPATPVFQPFSRAPPLLPV